MGCCGSKDVPVVIKNTEDSTAPVRKRRCTDVVFLLLFIIALGGAGYISFRAVQRGDPGRYIYGVDSWGNVCGRRENQQILDSRNSSTVHGNKSFLENSGLDRSNHSFRLNLGLSDLRLILNPEHILSSEKAPVVLCVKECPQADSTQCQTLLTENGYNVGPGMSTDRICQMPGQVIFPHEALLNICVPKALTAIGHGLAEASLATADAMSHALHGNGTIPAQNSEENSLQSSSARVVNDVILSITENWKTMLYLLLIAFGISMLTIVLLQLFTRVLVITIIIAATFGTGGLTGFLWYKYSLVAGLLSKDVATETLTNFTSSTEDLLGVDTNFTDIVASTVNLTSSLSLGFLGQKEYLLPMAIVVTILTILCWIILIWTRKSLKLVISLFDEASVALFSMPALLFQPIKTVVWLAIVFGGFLVIGAYLLSDQIPIVLEDGLVEFVDEATKLKQLFIAALVFVFLWFFEFIFACHEIILAGTISSWFFNRNQKKSKCPCNPFATVRPTIDLVFYNLGSAALGSLIIAIVQFIRLILAYLQKKLRKMENKTAKFILKCLQCCLACFEKVLKYINRNAYICIAMYGESFCTSAKKALALLVSNAQHVVALNCISGFCLLLGKVTVVAVVGALGYVWLGAGSASDVKFVVPMVLTCLGAFFISSCFMSVFGMAIDTIFLCFCDDQQRNNGEDRPYYSSARLRKFMDSAGKGKKEKKQQPKSSAGPTTSSTSTRQQGSKSLKSKSYSSSFTRISIPAHVNRPRAPRKTKVYPLKPT